MSQIEQWEDVKGYEGYYQVSDLGRVRSLERTIIDSLCTRIFKGKVLKQTEHNGKQPYFYVTLSKSRKNKKLLVHRLVAETFIPNEDNKEQVNHIDGDPQNNTIINLEWVTNAENTQHAYDTGLYVNSKRGRWYQPCQLSFLDINSKP